MILKIPRGKVSTYGAVAAAAGYPRGARLTVRALNQAHGLPWHRVVAAGGRIATPGEHALDQRFRLEMESVKFSGRKVRMAEFEFKFAQKAKRKSVKPAVKTVKKAARKSVPRKKAGR
jgi:methylated-DNA-protein-cysteine methyltransferase-like protein